MKRGKIVDELLDRRMVRTEERTFQNLHHDKLATLLDGVECKDVRERLVTRTLALAVSHSIAFHGALALVGSDVPESLYDTSVYFSNEITEHRAGLERFGSWTVVSEEHALETAKTLDNIDDPDHTVVLCSEVAGSISLSNHDVRVVCGASRRFIDLKDSYVCRCGGLVAENGSIVKAGKRNGHICSDRMELAQAVSARLILSTGDAFPFTLLVDIESRKYVAPIDVITALGHLHFDGILPAFKYVSHDDMLFIKRNGSLINSMLQQATARCMHHGHDLLRDAAPLVAALSMAENQSRSIVG